MERRRSISAQCSGEEQTIIVPVSFSTHRKAGMSSFEPSRIPAWLAPVCEERSVSHSASRYPSSSIQRAITGALPSRMARRRTGRARPSISRKMIPGTSVRGRAPWRRATRRTTRRAYSSWSFVPSMTWSTIETAEITSDASSAIPNESTSPKLGTTSSASTSANAFRASTSRKPTTSVNGSRSDATTGGSSALKTAIRAATAKAAPGRSRLKPGTIPAAT